jgi:hypothetical protein
MQQNARQQQQLYTAALEGSLLLLQQAFRLRKLHDRMLEA